MSIQGSCVVSFHYYFSFKLGEQGVHEVNNETALDLRTFFAHRLEILLKVPYNSVKSRK